MERRAVEPIPSIQIRTEHLTYFGASDIPFQRALAQAFTVCDNNFCSVLGPTSPNRLYLWSGTIDPEGQHGGPCTANPGDYLPVFNWTTYPERLQRAGVSWQVYANDEVGDGDTTVRPRSNCHCMHTIR